MQRDGLVIIHPTSNLDVSTDIIVLCVSSGWMKSKRLGNVVLHMLQGEDRQRQNPSLNIRSEQHNIKKRQYHEQYI